MNQNEKEREIVISRGCKIGTREKKKSLRKWRFLVVISSGLRNNDFVKSFAWAIVGFNFWSILSMRIFFGRAMIRTQGHRVKSANATSVLCKPPRKIKMVFEKNENNQQLTWKDSFEKDYLGFDLKEHGVLDYYFLLKWRKDFF